MEPHGAQSQPIFLLPRSVMTLAMILLVIHAAYEFSLDGGGKMQVWIWFGFIPARFFETGIQGGMLPLLWTPITHAFLHGGWVHVFMNVAWLAIFGTPIAHRYGGFVFLLIFLAGVLGGVAFYTVLELHSVSVLIGASGGVAGLTGAAMRFVFQPVLTKVNPETGEIVSLGRQLASFPQMWHDTRARVFTLFWLGINFAVPLYGFVVGTEGPMIAWQAHIGGFMVGLVLPDLIERIKLQPRS